MDVMSYYYQQQQSSRCCDAVGEYYVVVVVVDGGRSCYDQNNAADYVEHFDSRPNSYFEKK